MRRLNVTIIAGLIAALLGAVLVFSYGRNVDERIAEGEEKVNVLVATGDLEAGAPADSLTQSVQTEQIPRAYVVEGALDSLADVQGLTLVAPVPAGTQISQGLFASEGEAIALQPEDGSVAVAVQVGLPAGVARYIAPGSFVDMFATYERLEGQDKAAFRSKLMLSGVRVLSVSVAQSFGQDDDSGTGLPVPVDQVLAVLEVKPQAAEKVVNAATLGTVYLALANEGETHDTPGGVTPDDVVKGDE